MCDCDVVPVVLARMPKMSNLTAEELAEIADPNS